MLAFLNWSFHFLIFFFLFTFVVVACFVLFFCVCECLSFSCAFWDISSSSFPFILIFKIYAILFLISKAQFCLKCYIKVLFSPNLFLYIFLFVFVCVFLYFSSSWESISLHTWSAMLLEMEALTESFKRYFPRRTLKINFFRKNLLYSLLIPPYWII